MRYQTIEMFCVSICELCLLRLIAPYVIDGSSPQSLIMVTLIGLMYLNVIFMMLIFVVGFFYKRGWRENKLFISQLKKNKQFTLPSYALYYFLAPTIAILSLAVFSKTHISISDHLVMVYLFYMIVVSVFIFQLIYSFKLTFKKIFIGIYIGLMLVPTMYPLLATPQKVVPSFIMFLSFVLLGALGLYLIFSIIRGRKKRFLHTS